MRCPNCGAEINKRWKFCPNCSARLRKNFFDTVFNRFSNEMKGFDKLFERQFEVFDLRPFFRKPTRGKGFTIKITRGTGQKPKVSVQTFGDVNKERVAQELSRLGVRGFKKRTLEKPVAAVKTGPSRVGLIAKKTLPKVTEEPKTEVKRVGKTVVVDMHVPGVNNAQDIEIKDLAESVEVKAIAGDKAFFKILTKPSNSRIISKIFKNGKLHLEFA